MIVAIFGFPLGATLR